MINIVQTANSIFKEYKDRLNTRKYSEEQLIGTIEQLVYDELTNRQSGDKMIELPAFMTKPSIGSRYSDNTYVVDI